MLKILYFPIFFLFKNCSIISLLYVHSFYTSLILIYLATLHPQFVFYLLVFFDCLSNFDYLVKSTGLLMILLISTQKMTPKKPMIPNMYSIPAVLEILDSSTKKIEGAPLVFLISSSRSLFISSLKSYISKLV